MRMKRVIGVFIIGLLLTSVACDQLPAKQYNEDGSGSVPITFEYPYTWEVVEDSDGDGVYAFLNTENVTKNDDGSIDMLSSNVAYIFIVPDSPQQDEAGKVAPLVRLEEYEARINDRQQELQEIINEQDLSDFEPTSLDGFKVYESTQPYNMCDDKEVVGMKSQQFITGLHEVEAGTHWNFYVTDEELPIFVGGYFGVLEIEEEKFEEIFESVICSLELHD